MNSPFERNDLKSAFDPLRYPVSAINSELSTILLLKSESGTESEYEFRFLHQLLEPRLELPMLSRPHLIHCDIEPSNSSETSLLTSLPSQSASIETSIADPPVLRGSLAGYQDPPPPSSSPASMK